MLRTFGPSVLRAGLLVAAAALWSSHALPEPGEELFLRWVRVGLAHPWRTTLALALLDFARSSRRVTAAATIPQRPSELVRREETR